MDDQIGGSENSPVPIYMGQQTKGVGDRTLVLSHLHISNLLDHSWHLYSVSINPGFTSRSNMGCKTSLLSRRLSITHRVVSHNPRLVSSFNLKGWGSNYVRHKRVRRDPDFSKFFRQTFWKLVYCMLYYVKMKTN